MRVMQDIEKPEFSQASVTPTVTVGLTAFQDCILLEEPQLIDEARAPPSAVPGLAVLPMPIQEAGGVPHIVLIDPASPCEKIRLWSTSDNTRCACTLGANQR